MWLLSRFRHSKKSVSHRSITLHLKVFSLENVSFMLAILRAVILSFFAWRSMAVANQVWPTIVNYCAGLNLNVILLLVDYTGVFWDSFLHQRVNGQPQISKELLTWDTTLMLNSNERLQLKDSVGGMFAKIYKR